MKYVRILFYILLAIPAIILIMVIWPKGSVEDQLASRNVPALGYGIIMNGEVTESDVIGELEAGVEVPDNAIFNVADSAISIGVTLLILFGNKLFPKTN